MTADQLRTEGAITFNQAAAVVRDILGRKPAKATLIRWHKRGSHGVRLEACQVGKIFFTTRKAVEEFISANGPESDPATVLDAVAAGNRSLRPRAETQQSGERRSQAMDEAKAWLRQHGLRFLLVC